MRKIGFAVASMILVTVFIVTVAEAGWIIGTINKVYQYPSSIVIEVKRTSDSALIRKVVDATNEKSVLAVALTAQANSDDVEVYLNTGSNTFTALGIIP
ncbi:MAG: hypothetical protein ACNYWU_10275 [Desulfobacterales bacterium]